MRFLVLMTEADHFARWDSCSEAEQLGGFYLVDLPLLADAVEAARLLPSAYTIEVRPVLAT